MIVFDLFKRGYEVQKNTRIHWLVIDGEYSNPTIIPMKRFQVGEIETDGSRISGKYALSKEIIQRILRARSVGFAMKTDADSRVFTGFYGMDFAEGATKLPGLLRACMN
jgi:hypothetical protein